MKTTKILIACGGSGGHIFPGIALAEALRGFDETLKISIITSDRYIDTQIFREELFPYSVLPYNGLPRNFNPFKIFKFLVELVKAVVKSFILLKAEDPDCVVGLGGYVSGPVSCAAWFMRKTVLIHEQNVVPSLTNKFSSLFAKKICVTFEDTKKYFGKKPTVKTGNPIRFQFLEEGLDSLSGAKGFDKNKFNILLMGGSQGSTVLNDSFKNAVLDMDNAFKKRLRVVHIAGKKDFLSIDEAYKKAGLKVEVYPFMDRIGRAYKMADLVISRAGATALSEIVAFGKPSILVPYPRPWVHQKENAEFFSWRGASRYMKEEDLGSDHLKEAITRLMEDSDLLSQMSRKARALSNPEAARNLAREVLHHCTLASEKCLRL